MPDSFARAVGLSSILRALCSALALAGAAAAGVAHAQPYRHVAADGRITYSDIPPAGVAVAPRAASGSGSPTASSALSRRGDASREEDASGAAERLTALPYAVRSAASRHPVVLYTSTDCAPCADARAHLSRRGVPFTERQVNSAADVAALRRRGFAADGFPAVSIGAQRLTGFDAGSWEPLLDAAGYPKTSALPSGWRAPAARPLDDGSGGKAVADSASSAALAGRNGTGTFAPSPRPVSAEASAPASASAPVRKPAAITSNGSASLRF